jgi:hypothetical protein
MATAKFVKTLRMGAWGTALEKAEVLESAKPTTGRHGRYRVRFADGHEQWVSKHPDFTIIVKEA